MGETGTVGIVGAGTMGAGIAQVALEAGERVVLFDVAEDAVERARARVRDGLARRASRLELDAGSIDDWVDGRLERLRPATSLEALASGAGLVIEAALEDLSVKRDVLERLDRAAAPDAILATNTSALSVGAIAAAARDPGRVLGLHFFNPAPLMPLVELVVPPAARAAAVDAAEERIRGWGKTPVRCADTPGFIVNRVNRPFTLEPLRMLEAGEAGVAAIDEAVRAAGYPMGPFAYMDLVGLDVNLAAARSVFAGLGRPERLAPSPIQERLVALGRLGRKTGGGFYGPDGRTVAAVPGAVPPAGDRAIGPGAIVERVELAIANEAFFALGEGVAPADQIDLALRLGANHPHGPIEHARARGLAAVRDRLLALRSAHGGRFEPAPALRGTGDGT